MTKIGKISVIKVDNNSSTIQTMQNSLARKGMTRIPGTGVFKYPYKEQDGFYRTGLDPKAAYIRRIADEVERNLEIERVTKLKAKLEEQLGVDLGPRSEFWNHAKATSADDIKHVQPVKLKDGDNYFDLSIPMQELAYSWLRVHPTIASSYQAWERGEFPADTQFYVSDDDIENQVVYKKKQLINKAIIKFDAMTYDKKRKVARQLGLPVDENTKEEVVYNLVDNLLKQTEFKEGKHQGLNPVTTFHKYADMKESLLHIKDLIAQAIAYNIYRVRNGGKLFKGEYEVAKDEDTYVAYLMDDDHQEDLLMLEDEVKTKKLIAV